MNTTMKQYLNGGSSGMGASLAVIELEKERNLLGEQESALDLEIESLTFYRDQLLTELNAVNAARRTTPLQGMGLFKSAYRKQMEKSINKRTQRIREKTRILASLKQEVEQLQFQLSLIDPKNEVAQATKQAFAPGMNLNPKVLIAVAAVAGLGYLAYKKGWLEKVGLKF